MGSNNMEKITLCILAIMLPTMLALPISTADKMAIYLSEKENAVEKRSILEPEDIKKLLEEEGLLHHLKQNTKSAADKRFLDIDELLPKKRSQLVISPRTIGSSDQSSPVSSAEDLQRLQKLLTKLSDRLAELKTANMQAETTTVNEWQQKTRLLGMSLYRKLINLDADIHKLLSSA